MAKMHWHNVKKVKQKYSKMKTTTKGIEQEKEGKRVQDNSLSLCFQMSNDAKYKIQHFVENLFENGRWPLE